MDVPFLFLKVYLSLYLLKDILVASNKSIACSREFNSKAESCQTNDAVKEHPAPGAALYTLWQRNVWETSRANIWDGHISAAG